MSCSLYKQLTLTPGLLSRWWMLMGLPTQHHTCAHTHAYTCAHTFGSGWVPLHCIIWWPSWGTGGHYHELCQSPDWHQLSIIEGFNPIKMARLEGHRFIECFQKVPDVRVSETLIGAEIIYYRYWLSCVIFKTQENLWIHLVFWYSVALSILRFVENAVSNSRAHDKLKRRET